MHSLALMFMIMSQVWWHTAVIPVLCRLRQGVCFECKVILVYIVSLGPA